GVRWNELWWPRRSRLRRPSALSTFSFGVQILEPRSRVVDSELPIDSALLLITPSRPGRGLAAEFADGGKAAVPQALPMQRTQFVFRHVQPTPVLRRVPELQPPDQGPGLVRGERLVERAHRVRVQVVADQDHLLGLGVPRPQ